ncbi:unnamed protein product, partial [Taenia asiatica]|uniref:Neurofilament heavy polypeptide-like n=1 Tax=Taenia asiatica TaxID=60517 RepID=A0A0R3W9G4_TAEAS
MGKVKNKERRSLQHPDQATTDDNEVTNSSTGAVKPQEKVMNVGVPTKTQKKRKIDVKRNQDSNDSANTSTEIEPPAKRLALPIAVRNDVTTVTMSVSVTARKGADKQKNEERFSSREQQLRTVLTRLGEKRTITEADDENKLEQEPPSKKLALVQEKGLTVVAKNQRNMNSRGETNAAIPKTLSTVAAIKHLEKAKKKESSGSSGWSSKIKVERKEECIELSDSSSEEEGALKKPTAAVSNKPTPVVLKKPSPVVSNKPTPVVSKKPTPVVSKKPVAVKRKKESSESSDSSSKEEGAVKKPTPVMLKKLTPVVSKKPVAVEMNEECIELSDSSSEDV